MGDRIGGQCGEVEIFGSRVVPGHGCGFRFRFRIEVWAQCYSEAYALPSPRSLRMLLTFAWPVCYRASDVKVARKRGWLTCTFHKCDFWDMDAEDVAVARVDMEKMVKWDGEEELGSLCRKMCTPRRGGGVDLVPAFGELRRWLSRVFTFTFEKPLGTLLVMRENGPVGALPEFMVLMSYGIRRDEWHRPVVEIMFVDCGRTTKAVTNPCDWKIDQKLELSLSDGGMRMLRRLLYYCQRLNEPTLWQRCMTAQEPICKHSFLPMLDGTAGGEGGGSLSTDLEELSESLKDVQHLREQTHVANQDVLVGHGFESETSNLEALVLEDGKGAKEGNAGKEGKVGKSGRVKLVTCDGCGADKGERKLSRCSSCMVVGYCSKECQNNSWKEHRSVCLKGE